MRKFKNIQSTIARFTRWSRKSWAIFASLHREVQIGNLKISLINKSFVKNLIEKLSSTFLTILDFSIIELLTDEEILENSFGVFGFSENNLMPVAIQNSTKKIKKYSSLKIFYTPKVLLDVRFNILKHFFILQKCIFLSFLRMQESYFFQMPFFKGMTERIK